MTFVSYDRFGEENTGSEWPGRIYSTDSFCFTPGAAVLIGTALFWVSHGQYQKLDPFLLTHSVLTFAGAAVMAWSVVKTGSIVPALVAHALFNVPLQPVLMAVSLGIGIALILALRRLIRESLFDFWRTLATTREWPFLAGTVVVLLGRATLLRAYSEAIPAVLGVCVAVAMAGLIRRAPWTRCKGKPEKPTKMHRIAN